MYTLNTFGALALEARDRALRGAATQRRRIALLAFVAAAHPRGISREKIIAVFWPEHSDEHGRRALNQAIYALRKDLDADRLFEGVTELRINPAVLSSDVAQFTDALECGDNNRAVALYQGPFLDGVHLGGAPGFEWWVDAERERRARQYAEALGRLVAEAETTGDLQLALRWSRLLTATDPVNAAFARQLMLAYARLGDRTGALKHAQIYAALVQGELGVEPDRLVTDFAARLRSGALLPEEQPVVRAPSAVLPPPATEPTVAPPPNPPVPSTVPTGRSEATALDTGHPSSPAAPLPRATPARQRSRRRASVAAGMALLLTMAAIVGARRTLGSAPIEDQRLAIAPFAVLEPSLAMWGEGMMDVLSYNLDGAGPVTTIAPSAVMRVWEGRSDAASAARLAQATGASFAVFGNLTPVAGDSVRVAATIQDVRRTRVLAQLEYRQSVRNMATMVDSLTVGVLRALGEQSPVGAVRQTTLGAGIPLPTLRSFLQGEQHYRRAQWDSARAHYEDALGRDGRFGLAHYRLGSIHACQGRGSSPLAYEHLLRANSNNRGLGRRDSTLVLAGSLVVAREREADPRRRERLEQQLLAVLSEATRRYPRNPDVWFALGEVRYHHAQHPGEPSKRKLAFQAFQRAISGDSSFAPAYLHMPELAMRAGNRALAKRYQEAFVRHGGHLNQDDESLSVAIGHP